MIINTQDKGSYGIEAARFGIEGAPIFSARFQGPTTEAKAKMPWKKEDASERQRWKTWRKLVQKVSDTSSCCVSHQYISKI